MKNLKVLFTVLCVACATATWGAEVTLDFTSNNYSLVTSASTSENTFSVDGITFGYKSCYFNTSGKYLMMAKSAGVLYCKSPIGTNITSIAVTYSSGTSTKGSLDVFFANVEKNTRATSGYDVQLGVATSSTKTADNKNSGKNYFNISVHNANNVQVTKIVVTYDSSGSGETTKYTVQWMVDGQPYTTGNPTTSVKSGEKVSTLPTDPADDRLSCAEKFMGWSAQNIGATPQIDAPADLFTTADASPAITENTTFYAVFAKPQQNNK